MNPNKNNRDFFEDYNNDEDYSVNKHKQNKKKNGYKKPHYDTAFEDGYYDGNKRNSKKRR